MKKVVFLFLFLLFSVWLGVFMHDNSGYVLISYKDTSIETSLWFMVIALIACFLVFYFLLRFGAGFSAITTQIKNWLGNRKKRRAHTNTVLGLYELVEGNWVSAEKRLTRSARDSDMSLINYLAASFVAKRQGAYKRSDSYLQLAQKLPINRPIAIGLAQARSQIDAGDWEGAGVILKQLYKLQPKNIFVLQLLKQVYMAMRDWRGLELLVPILRKRHVLKSGQIERLEKTLYSELLLAGAKNHNIDGVWSSMPGYLQKDTDLVAIYVKYLLDHELFSDAEHVLKMVLRKTLDDKLLWYYASLSSVDPIKQLMRAEDWLQTNANNASLLLCLGRMCRHQKLWGKARLYLEKSLHISPSVIVYIELAKVMDEQGDSSAVLGYYAKAASLLENSTR